MTESHEDIEQRRRFLKYLMGSPLLAAGFTIPWLNKAMASDSYGLLEADNAFYKDKLNGVITTAREAINVFDFERVAKLKLPPAHYGYVATGVNGNETMRANRKAFESIQIRARHLVDYSQLDSSVNLFGEKWPSPIALAPVSSQSNMHPEGDVATARACRQTQTLQIHSSFASKSIEDVNEAYGRAVWFQLYAAESWDTTLKMIKRAETAGCKVLVFTVDMFAGSNRETLSRFIEADNRDCKACHTKSHFEKPMTAGMNYQFAQSLTWDYVKRLKDSTKMKVVIKGVVTSGDARLSIINGADGIIVSNHGGRALETGRASIDCLPEIVAEVNREVPLLIDSGFRRGTDVFKALALGADAVCIGRPFLWGLAAFGSKGVSAVINIIQAELEMVMKKSGAVRADSVNASFLV